MCEPRWKYRPAIAGYVFVYLSPWSTPVILACRALDERGRGREPDDTTSTPQEDQILNSRDNLLQLAYEL